MGKQTKTAEAPSVNSERIVRPHEHEIWLSFPGDSGAATFHDWWIEAGRDLWLEYHAKYRGNYE